MKETQPEKERNLLLSPFTEVLHGRSLGVSQAQADEILTGYSILHRRFQRSLKRFLCSLDKYEAQREEHGWKDGPKNNSNEPLDDYLDAVYAAAELYEFYEGDVVKFIKPSAKEKNLYRSYISSLKREFSVICNKCKHDHAFLQMIEILYDNGTGVSGFAVFKMAGRTVDIIGEIHREREAFSFNWASRRLIANILAADCAAAKLIENTNQKPGEPVVSLSFTLPIFEEIKLIQNRSKAGMPKEKREPIVELNNNTLEIIIDKSDENFNGLGNMLAIIDLISENVTIKLPYIEGEANINRSNTKGPGQPLPEYFRCIIGNLRVEDS